MATLIQTVATLVQTMATLIQDIFLVFPPLSNEETAHRPTTRISEDPIYFYDSDKPYFELAKLLSLSESLSLLMLDYFIPRHQVHKLLQPPHRIPRTDLSNRRAPYAFYHPKRVAG
jgi:hypothetical protein